jgi:hypothetical protein
MTKHGACDMIYKPEHITDLDSGAIVAATVRHGNEGDTKELAKRVVAAGETLARVCESADCAAVAASMAIILIHSVQGEWVSLGNWTVDRGHG